jgi:flavodoxin
MKVVIVYDSFFGNTEKIANAISESLCSPEDVRTFRVNGIKPDQLTGLDLLIVGSPTRAFRPTMDIIGFLNQIPSSDLKGVNIAAFDTRYSIGKTKVLLTNIFSRQFGYAAESIAYKLVKKGGTLIAPPMGFIVTDSEGPLKPGELERATDWANAIENVIHVQKR